MNLRDRDKQILEHIRYYCLKIEKTVERFGKEFDLFQNDADYCVCLEIRIYRLAAVHTIEPKE